MKQYRLSCDCAESAIELQLRRERQEKPFPIPISLAAISSGFGPGPPGWIGSQVPILSWVVQEPRWSRTIFNMRRIGSAAPQRS